MTTSPSPTPLVLRPAAPVDEDALARLAALDSAEPLRGEVLLAFAGGDVRAALSLQTGRVIADPFWPSAPLVDLLHSAAGDRRARRRRPRVRRRPAFA